jgi:hypothetical protein
MYAQLDRKVLHYKSFRVIEGRTNMDGIYSHHSQAIIHLYIPPHIATMISSIYQEHTLQLLNKNVLVTTAAMNTGSSRKILVIQVCQSNYNVNKKLPFASFMIVNKRLLC